MVGAKKPSKRKARELVLLMEGDKMSANFTNSTSVQRLKTIRHLDVIYGRKFELVRFKEVLPKRKVKKGK